MVAFVTNQKLENIDSQSVNNTPLYFSTIKLFLLKSPIADFSLIYVAIIKTNKNDLLTMIAIYLVLDY